MKRTKNVVKLDIIVLKQKNIEVLHVVYVIESKVYLKKLRKYFRVNQKIMIILL